MAEEVNSDNSNVPWQVNGNEWLSDLRISGSHPRLNTAHREKVRFY